MSAAELARAIAAGERSARDVVQAHLDRIDEVNPTLNAVTVTLADEALAAADAADASVARGGPLPPLLGVPFTVKENIDVAGTVTSMGLRGGVPATRDAPHIAHLRAAGAIPIARTNLPDLALRWHTDNARHGATVNPFDASLSPGGSSGGDAVALASGMAAFAVGSDYGGSLRVPAALAGVYALRPTPGRLAQTFGAPPLMSRQLMASDGPLARRAEDLLLLLTAMGQPDARDPRFTPASAAVAQGPIAVVLASDAERMAADALVAAGHEVVEAEAPRVEDAAQLWLDLVSFEVRLGALARLREEGSEGTRRSAEALFALGRTLDGDGYARALGERHLLTAAWSEFFDRHSLLLGPVSTSAPWRVGHDLGGADALRDEWWGFRLTVATACLGLPAVSVPIGFDARGLPLGVQLVGPRWAERALLAVAEAIRRPASSP
ncbi:amidase family protein [Solirubrobacter soli]|uniref:amidase family protein n=1 Tax=Solirubrobacter soli TaxID=363832 RepID=UPI0003F571D1|nr:amidase family protein [Solirubrobacter soli]